jgi:hypothetical protein
MEVGYQFCLWILWTSLVGQRGVSMMTNDQLDIALEENRVYNYNQIGEDQYLVDAEKDLTDIKGKSIAIASAVTSFARMELYHVMSAIIRQGIQNHVLRY